MSGWVVYRRRHVKKFGHGKEFHGLRFLSPSTVFFFVTLHLQL